MVHMNVRAFLAMKLELLAEVVHQDIATSCVCRGFLMLFMEMGMSCFLSCLFS